MNKLSLVFVVLLVALFAFSSIQGQVSRDAVIAKGARQPPPKVLIKAWLSRPRNPKLRNSKDGNVVVHFLNTFSKPVAVFASGTPLDLKHQRWPPGKMFHVSFYDVDHPTQKIEAQFNGVSVANTIVGKRNFVVLPPKKPVRFLTKLAKAYSNRKSWDKSVDLKDLRFKANLLPITFKDYRVCDNLKATNVHNCASKKKVAYWRKNRNGKGYKMYPLKAKLPKVCENGHSVTGVLFPRERKRGKMGRKRQGKGGKGKGKGGKGKGHSAFSVSTSRPLLDLTEGYSAAPNPRITYHGCDSTKQNKIRTQLIRLMNDLKTCPQKARSFDDRYKTWFGHSLEGYRAYTVFNNVKNHLNSNQLNIKCPGGSGICSGANAYVSPNDRSHNVHLCNNYFSRSTTHYSEDHNSQPSILLHEYSHFDDIGDNDDHAYGITPCKNLAKSNSHKARRNADSYGYYYDETYLTLESKSCFPPLSTVQDLRGNIKPLGKLKRGDKVVAYDLSRKKLVEDEVIGFFHRHLSQKATYLQFSLEDGSRFTVSPTHLVFKSNSQAVFAKTISQGDFLLQKGVGIRVESISEEVLEGFISPITHSGTIVVDGVVSSCYADLNSHRIAHASLFPLRMAWRLSRWIRIPSSWFESEEGEILGYARGLTAWTNAFAPSLFA